MRYAHRLPPALPVMLCAAGLLLADALNPATAAASRAYTARVESATPLSESSQSPRPQLSTVRV